VPEFFTRVSTNMKIGADVVLGQRTVLFGRSGNGKSTIVQSIELATCGYVSDVEGRDEVKQKGALQRLFPIGVAPAIECTMSDGRVYTWKATLKEGDGKLDEIEHIRPRPVRWAVQELRRVLGSEAATVAAWLEQQVLGSLTEEELLAPLPVEVHPEVRSLAKKLKRKGRLDFLSMAKAAREEARALRAEATRSEKTVEQMTIGVAPALSDEERSAMQARLDGLLTVKGMTKAEYNALEDRIQEGVAAFGALEVELQRTASVTPELVAAIGRLQKAIAVQAQHRTALGPGGCWVCGVGSDEAIEAQRQQMEHILADLTRSQSAAMQRMAITMQLQALETQLRQQVATRDAAVVVEDTSEEVEGLRRRLASDEANRRTWRNAEAVRLDVRKHRARADHLSAAGKSMADVGVKHLEAKKHDFEQSVSSLLPSGEQVGIDLDSARIGLVRGSEFHSALSGAEGNRVLMALAAKTNGDQDVIIAPEDRAWDPITLTAVMEALAETPAQVLIMSTVRPAAVPGWTVVELGEHSNL